MLSKLRLKRLSGDKTYVALTAAASPTSPLKQLIESVARETALDADRPDLAQKPAASGGAAAAEQPADPAAGAFLQDGPPGAAVDEAFRSFQDVLAGDAGARPVDLVLKALGAISADLKRAASSPADAPQVGVDLQQQIATLRTLSASLPKPFNDMMNRASADFDNEGVTTAIAVMSQSLGEVTNSCRSVVENLYPFVRNSSQDLGLVDFARVFGPGGELDRYFAQNLAKYADKSKRDWTWKTADPVGRALSAGTIRSFQQASQIRDAFFAAGAAQPSFMVTVTPPAVNDPQVTAQMDFYGTPIQSKLGGNAPTTAAWPGGGNYQLKITVTTTPAVDPTAPKLDNSSQPPAQPDISTLASKNGVWALFRLLDDAARGGTKVTFFSGGQDYAYQFSPTSAANPLNLNMLRQFHCPANI